MLFHRDYQRGNQQRVYCYQGRCDMWGNWDQNLSFVQKKRTTKETRIYSVNSTLHIHQVVSLEVPKENFFLLASPRSARRNAALTVAELTTCALSWYRALSVGQISDRTILLKNTLLWINNFDLRELS